MVPIRYFLLRIPHHSVSFDVVVYAVMPGLVAWNRSFGVMAKLQSKLFLDL
jgi:hypothetical protein